MAILSRPETVRATRTAAVTASEPVLQKAARSMPDHRAQSAAPPRPPAATGGRSRSPAELGATASVTKAGEWPNRFRPKPLTRSTYSLPSTSQSFEPDERSATIGYTISFQIGRKPATERGSARRARCAAVSCFEPAVRAV